MGEIERKAVILHYAGIAARAKNEEGENKLAEIVAERLEIEKSLSMTPEQILVEAAKLLVRE